MHNSLGISNSGPAAASHTSKKILVVDDESLIRSSIKGFCEKEGYGVITASSGLKALKSIEEENPGIILLDINLPDANGLELLKTIKEMNPETIVILITGNADVRGAVEAMKIGAYDYLVKPLDFNNLKKILTSIKVDTAPSAAKSSDMGDFVFVSDKMKEIIRIMERLATKTDVTVLVTGESGTGKSSLCKKMHELSPRKDKPFVEIGCSNIPDHLIESELFGYEKGAFTDAKADKKGLIEIAQGGTVFLDEIGDMPYQMQSKILDLIEERRFRRIGGLKYTHADVRIFAATNVNLQDLVHSKKFRLDLFYRLNVAAIEMPSLRERKEDLPLLVQYFLNHYATKYDGRPKGITPRALEILQHYSWPGNVRELKNLVERFVILSKNDEIDINDIPSNILSEKPLKTAEAPAEAADHVLPTTLSLKAMEAEFIKTALKLADGNQRKAAKLLDVSRDTLRYRLKKLKIDVPDDK
ncbi:MAG: sigma-54-dependent transcriptional regulator [Nitrospirota bacterium]